MNFLISLSGYVGSDKFGRKFILMRATEFGIQMVLGLSLKYYVRILKGGFEAMIPEKVCEGRMGADKKGAANIAGR